MNGYASRWCAVEDLALWEAAALWVDREPDWQRRFETYAQLAFDLLRQAAMNGELVVDAERPVDIHHRTRVTRAALLRYAYTRNMLPTFLATPAPPPLTRPSRG